jgi:hypothetical protein
MEGKYFSLKDYSIWGLITRWFNKAELFMQVDSCVGIYLGM